VSADEQIERFEDWAKIVEADLPQIILPSDHVTISACAKRLFRIIATTKSLFVRGGAVVYLVTRDDGLLALDLLRPAAARSFFEKHGKLFALRAGKHGKQVLKPATCPEQMAEALLNTEEAAQILPRVQGLINCPVIREINGQLKVAGPGYDEEMRLLITGGEIPPEVALDEAVPALLDLLAEFDFESEADKARAVASMISPVLKTGGFLRGRVPADVAEADKSQSGKTYRQRVVAALYREKLSLVTCREGGVGSLDESLNQQLVAGRPFIQFDNFRGPFESAHLEAFLTAEGSFPCRVPHRGQVTVSPESYFIFLTSNGVNTTQDFANRSNIIRIRTKAAGFGFRRFPEGDLLEMVRKKQPYYLGCLFAVVREWHRLGKPQSKETRHHFREWVQVLDWIGQNIFKTVAIMDGHKLAQERVSTPALVWLRKVALNVDETGEVNRPLTATDIYSLCDSQEIEIPGLRPGSDEEKSVKVIGRIMAKLFKDSESLEVAGFNVTRNETYLAREDVSTGGSYKSRIYTVTRRLSPQ
jgi:hypothetical protein